MTKPPATKPLPRAVNVIAPDGSEVRLLADTDRGSMAHFTLAPGQVSSAVAHRTVEELWFVISGEGEMWRKTNGDETVTVLVPGLSLSIPVGTHFQFRCRGREPLCVVAVTMPPWPDAGEAYAVGGRW